jgi:hypothetical protein
VHSASLSKYQSVALPRSYIKAKKRPKKADALFFFLFFVVIITTLNAIKFI